MPWALRVKPSGLPPQDPYTQITYCGSTFELILNSVASPCWPGHILYLAQLLRPKFLTNSIASKRVHMKCLELS